MSVVLGIGKPIASGIVVKMFVVISAVEVDELALVVVFVGFVKRLSSNEIGAIESVAEAVVGVVDFDDGLVRSVFPYVLGDSVKAVEGIGDGIVQREVRDRVVGDDGCAESLVLVGNLRDGRAVDTAWAIQNVVVMGFVTIEKFPAVRERETCRTELFRENAIGLSGVVSVTCVTVCDISGDGLILTRKEVAGIVFVGDLVEYRVVRVEGGDGGNLAVGCVGSRDFTDSCVDFVAEQCDGVREDTSEVVVSVGVNRTVLVAFGGAFAETVVRVRNAVVFSAGIGVEFLRETTKSVDVTCELANHNAYIPSSKFLKIL